MAVVTLVGAHDYLPCYGCPHNATNHICGNYEAAWSEIMVDRYLVKGRGEGSLNVDINAFSNHRPFGMMLSISQFSHMSVCVSVCSLLRYRLNVFLPPTSQSWMSHIFRDSESLGKSNGKKWSKLAFRSEGLGASLTIELFDFDIIWFFNIVSILFGPKL